MKLRATRHQNATRFKYIVNTSKQWKKKKTISRNVIQLPPKTFSRLRFFLRWKTKVSLSMRDNDYWFIPVIVLYRFAFWLTFFFFYWARTSLLRYTAVAGLFVQLVHCHVIHRAYRHSTRTAHAQLMSSSLRLSRAHIHHLHTHNWNRTECECTTQAI